MIELSWSHNQRFYCMPIVKLAIVLLISQLLSSQNGSSHAAQLLKKTAVSKSCQEDKTWV